MIRYFDSNAFHHAQNRYALVNAIAKRAREVLDSQEESQIMTEHSEQPVSTVLRELSENKIKLSDY